MTWLFCQHFAEWQNARPARRFLLFPKISLRCDFREPCFFAQSNGSLKIQTVLVISTEGTSKASDRVEKSCAVRIGRQYIYIIMKRKRGGSSFLRAGPAPQRQRRGRRKGRRKEKRKAAYFFRAEGAGAEKRRKTGAKRGCFPREILPRILTNHLSCGILFLPKHSGGVENVRKDHRLHRPFF